MAISRSYTPAKLLFPVLLAFAIPTSGRAAPGCEPRAVSRTSTKQWNEPLARTINLRAGDVSLKDALERLANASHLRFSYSTELLPLDRRVCASYKNTAVGDALLDMLRGVSVEPVVAGSDHIVLAPSTHIARSEDPEPSPVFPLSPLIATATAQQPDKQQPGLSFKVLHAEDIAQQGSLSNAFNALVPGMWAWQSPTGFTSTFTSRGASSFGVTAPKIYIDGIEVANPLLATQIAPEDIERIEIIRGPQGAALYGADALNGVTNIVTRHDVSATGGPHVRLRSGLALSQTDFTQSSAVGQDHAVGLQFGSRAQSANLNFGIGSIGEYMPGAFARHLSADGSVRLVGARTMLSATARVFSQSAGSPASLLMDTARYEITPLSMRQYTTGINASFRQSDRVTHSLVLGIDGYSLSDVAQDTAAPLTASDSVLRAWDDGLRTTLRFATVAQLDLGNAARGSLTFALDHSGLHQHGAGSTAAAYTGGWAMATGHRGTGMDSDSMSRTDDDYLTASRIYDQSRSANGVTAQFDAAVRERLFVNGGLRIEHDYLNGAGEGTATLPLIGMSYVLGARDFSVKLRGAYGKGVRWPEMPRIENSYAHARIVRPILSPEQQSGVEAGVDINVGQTLGLEVTRYNQTATGLSQMVALQKPASAPENWSGFALQSVGAIANRGWEMQAHLRRGPLTLTGSMALTDSRVQRVANGYTGDLQVGDRILGVPARTLALDASWSAQTWSASVTAARAYDWMNYDRAQLALQAQQPVGPALRAFWQPYNGFTHLRATLSRNITRDLTLLLIGDNLLDKQVGEPDNLTVVPGRTISFGIKASF